MTAIPVDGVTAGVLALPRMRSPSREPQMHESNFVFSTKEVVRYRFPTHVNDLVMDRAEAETSEVFIVVLGPGGGPPLHTHHDTEQVFYILAGKGLLQVEEPVQSYTILPGDVVRIPRHTAPIVSNVRVR